MTIDVLEQQLAELGLMLGPHADAQEILVRLKGARIELANLAQEINRLVDLSSMPTGLLAGRTTPDEAV